MKCVVVFGVWGVFVFETSWDLDSYVPIVFMRVRVRKGLINPFTSQTIEWYFFSIPLCSVLYHQSKHSLKLVLIITFFFNVNREIKSWSWLCSQQNKNWSWLNL
jgi:hypothetical protein